ncbi:MAG: hypothetical protein WC045_02720 [Patescibacteria group bacterium]
MLKKRNKKFYEILVAMTAIVIALVFGVWYSVGNHGGGILDRFSDLKTFTGKQIPISFTYPKAFSVHESSDNGNHIEILDGDKKIKAVVKASTLDAQYKDLEAYFDANNIPPDARPFNNIKGNNWYVYYDVPTKPANEIFAVEKNRVVYQFIVDLSQEEVGRKAMVDVLYSLIETVKLP